MLGALQAPAQAGRPPSGLQAGHRPWLGNPCSSCWKPRLGRYLAETAGVPVRASPGEKAGAGWECHCIHTGVRVGIQPHRGRGVLAKEAWLLARYPPEGLGHGPGYCSTRHSRSVPSLQ